MILFFPQVPAVYVFNGVYRNASFDFTGPVPRGSVIIQVSIALFGSMLSNTVQFDVVLSVTNYLPITLQHLDLVMRFHSLAIGVVELNNYKLFHDTVKLPQNILFDSHNISFKEQDALQDLELLASDLLKGQIELNFAGVAQLSIFGIPFSFEYYREAPVDWIDFFVNNTEPNPTQGNKYAQLFAPVLSGAQPASIAY